MLKHGGSKSTQSHAIGHGGWPNRLVLLLIALLLCVVCAELTVRAFWSLSFHVPFREPDRILYAYYPELRNIPREGPSHNDEFYDILLLGGSVLNSKWGPVEQALLEQLAENGHHNVRIFNLAKPAHTSRDSWLKYATLGDARFELVVFYHGINETRANNAPPEVFREDYSHYSWYKTVNALASYHGNASLALPYTLDWLGAKIEYLLNKDRHVPTNRPREDWVQYGQEPRSAESFKFNLGAIRNLARERDDQLLVMTIATYVPEDYSYEAFQEKHLDYVLHRSPIEIWGSREYVVDTVTIHNEIVRSLSAQDKGVLFVDQAILMSGNPRYFNDPCHFTTVGGSKFVKHMMSVLRPELKSG